MINLKKTHYTESLAALLLLVVFAACVLMVLFFGADAYSRLTQRDQVSYNSRTGIQYIATRVRQGDSLGNVTTEKFNGVDALVLDADAEYVTRLYCYGGSLRELYAEADLPMNPEDGEQVLEAKDMQVSLRDGLLQVELTDALGQTNNLTLSLRSRREGR